LKEHIITSMHLTNFQKIESKKIRTTFLTTFFSNNNTPTVIDLTDKELNNLDAVTIDNNTPTVIDLTKSDKELNNLATIIVDNNSQASKLNSMVTLKAQNVLDIVQKNGELTSSIYCKYSQVSNFNKWINYSFKELDMLIKNQENHPKKYRSNNLDKLLKYYKKEILDSKYQQLVKRYPVLGGLLEVVEKYRIEDWIANCIRYMVNKTIDEKWPIFIGMAQSVTKVLDKMEHNVTTMHGIQYNETFVDFLVVLISITVISGIPPLIIAVLPSDQKETLPKIIEENNLVVKYLNCAGAKLVGLYFDGAPHDRNWLGRMYFTNSKFQNKLGIIKETESILLKKLPLDLHLFENKLLLLSGTDFYHCIKKAFLEHIFEYACKLIEDFTLLDFLMMNEKIIKNIDIEMKGSIKRPDSDDGYNIHLGLLKESLDPELLLFLTEFEIGNMLEKVSTAMHGVLKSNGFLDEKNEEVEIGLIHYNTSELAIEKLLLSHQQRLIAHQNLPDKYDFATSNPEIYNSNNDNMFNDPIKIMKEMVQYRGEMEYCNE
ncbi:39858_t:CDS:10, partial [Gigaspora margarita]